MIKKLINRETVLYFIFGVMTTLVNYSIFHLLYNIMAMQSAIANILAFLAALVFAYVVNKLFVFESKSWHWVVIGPEMLQFLLARIFAFLIEEAGILISDNWLKLGRFNLFTLWGIEVDGVFFSKILLAVITVIINYIFCKLLVFKKK